MGVLGLWGFPVALYCNPHEGVCGHPHIVGQCWIRILVPWGAGSLGLPGGGPWTSTGALPWSCWGACVTLSALVYVVVGGDCVLCMWRGAHPGPGGGGVTGGAINWAASPAASLSLRHCCKLVFGWRVPLAFLAGAVPGALAGVSALGCRSLGPRAVGGAGTAYCRIGLLPVACCPLWFRGCGVGVRTPGSGIGLVPLLRLSGAWLFCGGWWGVVDSELGEQSARWQYSPGWGCFPGSFLAGTSHPNRRSPSH